MTDDLRTRIAAAIYGVQLPWDGHPWQSLTREAQSLYLEQADAVIAELGLKHYCRECGGWGPKDG